MSIARVRGMRSRPHAHTGFIPGPLQISPPLRCGRRRSWISLICQEPTRRRAQMSVPSVASHRRRRAAPAGRFARILRLLRWPVVIVWLVAVVALYPAAHTLSNLANGTAAANLPSSAPSTRVVELEQGPGQPDVDQATVVFVRSAGLTPADLAAAASARAAVARLATHVRGLGAPGQAQRSADGKADEFTADVTSSAVGDSEFDTDSKAVQDIRHAVGGLARGGLQVAVTGSAGLVTDGGVSSSTLNLLLLTAVLIVVIILVLVYRSPLLWLLPLLGALGAIVVAEASVHGLLNAGVTVSTLSAAILRVLVLGAATDYALLLIHRYREELRHHAATADAMAVALRRTLPTLLASAGTVTCAMVCLLAAQSASLHGLGPVGAVGIVSALLAQTTFLPALRPRAPKAGRPGREESRLWSGVGRRVARHPARVAIAAVLLLGVACVGLTSLRSDNSPLGEVKGHP